MTAGEATADHWTAIAPFSYGRWDADTQAFDAADAEQWNGEAARAYGAEGAFDPPAVRASLSTLDAPALVLAGASDVNTVPSAAAELAALLPKAELVVQPGVGHFPWLDDAERLAATTGGFLA